MDGSKSGPSRAARRYRVALPSITSEELQQFLVQPHSILELTTCLATIIIPSLEIYHQDTVETHVLQF
jgi:hypothetical protein